MAIFETTGILNFHLADCTPVFLCDENIIVVQHNTIRTPCEEVPYGVENIIITSPSGWLHYDELNGVHTFTMGDAPQIDTEEGAENG